VRITFLLMMSALAWFLWEPGVDIRDGRHDRGTNGMWLAHGWLGGDDWFRQYKKDTAQYRTDSALKALVQRCEQGRITDLFPHLCPVNGDGSLPAVHPEQVERFLDAMGDRRRVFPWIGGPGPFPANYGEEKWRLKFCDSIKMLLNAHPRFAGVQLNIEPLTSGDANFLTLLDEIRAALPIGKLLSVSAYPPPTRYHPVLAVHWDETFFREVSKRSDHLAVMMYDTALQRPKLYRRLMADWTEEVILWSGGKQVLLGVPTYSDKGVNYHDPATENLANAIPGIHAGLKRFKNLPAHYAGIAIYCDWETDAEEWRFLRERFLRNDEK
jgi:hypothetical protein